MRISREAMSSWFSMRLSMFSFMINMTAIGYSILSNNQNASLLGLLLTYSLNINEDIIWLIFNYAYLEMKMISVERVHCETIESAEPGRNVFEYFQICCFLPL